MILFYYSVTHDKEEKEQEIHESSVKTYDTTLVKYHIPSKTKSNLFTIKGIIYDVKYYNDKLYASTYEKETSIIKIIEINGNEQKIIDQYHTDAMQKMPKLIRYNNTLCYVKNDNKQLSINCLNGKSYSSDIPENTFSYIPILNNTESILLVTQESDVPVKQYTLKHFKNGEFKTLEYKLAENELQVNFVALMNDIAIVQVLKEDASGTSNHLLNINTGKKEPFEFKYRHTSYSIFSDDNFNLDKQTHIVCDISRIYTFKLKNNEILAHFETLPNTVTGIVQSIDNTIYISIKDKVYKMTP